MQIQIFVKPMSKPVKKSPTALYTPRPTSIEAIHIDILLFHIFLRLEPTSVARCKSVCKQWLSLLSAIDFTALHCHYYERIFNQKIIVLRPWHTTIYPLSSSYAYPVSNTVVSLPYEANPTEVNILTTINGLICLCSRNTRRLVIWNPLTNAYKAIPTTSTRGVFDQQYDTVGLYLQQSTEYTLLHVNRQHGKTRLYKYAQGMCVWKKVGTLDEQKLGTKNHEWTTGTFNNGFVYFVVTPTSSRRRVMLFAFDTQQEIFHKKPFPKVQAKPSDAHLVVIDNDLHIFVTHGFPFWTVDLWKMTCHGWSKVWVFPPIMPILLGLIITYINTTGKFMAVSNDGFTYQIDPTKNDNESYYHLLYYQGQQAIVYTETLAAP